jgi:TrmH family RNA methyltransferase
VAAVAAGAEIVAVTPAALRRLASTQTPQGPVAVMAVPDSALGAGSSVLVGWGVSDPGNVGTMIRIAAAFGWDYAAGPGSADPWSPKVLRSGAGAHFRTRVGRAGDLTDLGGRTTVATVVAGGAPPQAVAAVLPAAVLVGDEAAGLPAEVVDAAALRVTVPMPGGTESLNAAVAAAIVTYEAAVRGQSGG